MHMLHTTYLVLSYVRFYPCPNACRQRIARRLKENHFLFFFFFFFLVFFGPPAAPTPPSPLGRLTSEN